jgi:hypothetical protein
MAFIGAARPWQGGSHVGQEHVVASCGMGTERRQRVAEYGGDAVGRVTTVGAAWSMLARHVGQGDGAGMAVWRRGSHGARTGGQRPASACRPSGGATDARRRRGRRALERQEPKIA